MRAIDKIGEIFPVALEVLVAVIVFEGAFSIDVPYLRRVGSVVRNLLTVGVLITFALGALLAVGLDVLPWKTALLFGALVKGGLVKIGLKDGKLTFKYGIEEKSKPAKPRKPPAPKGGAGHGGSKVPELV